MCAEKTNWTSISKLKGVSQTRRRQRTVSQNTSPVIHSLHLHTCSSVLCLVCSSSVCCANAKSASSFLSWSVSWPVQFFWTLPLSTWIPLITWTLFGFSMWALPGILHLGVCISLFVLKLSLTCVPRAASPCPVFGSSDLSLMLLYTPVTSSAYNGRVATCTY